jgi:hypothetical protein
MPLVRNVIAGANVLASAKVARSFAFTVTQGSTSSLLLAELQTNTLPACVWYCIMSAGPANCTFNPQFAVDNRPVVGGGIEPNYFPVTIPQAVFLDVPLLVNARLISNMISASFTVPGGGANADITIILAASM